MTDETKVVEGEVVEEEPRTALALPDEQDTLIDLQQFQALAENRRDALRILMEMGVAATNPEDWCDQQGVPYPEQGACTSIINMVGMTITSPARRKETFDDEKGSYYAYMLEADVSAPRFGIGPIPIVGRCTSRDPFFGMRNKELRPQSEIDPGDILAKAYTNLRYRAVKAIVPLIASMTWERLEALTKGRVKREDVKEVHYAESEGTRRPEKAPKCPKCGKLMRKRRAKDGSEFWGCSGYPSCKGTRPLTEAAETPDKKQSEPPKTTPAPAAQEAPKAAPETATVEDVVNVFEGKVEDVTDFYLTHCSGCESEFPKSRLVWFDCAAGKASVEKFGARYCAQCIEAKESEE